MLSTIREHADSWLIKSILWGIIIAFVATIFYSWGMGGASASRGGVVATVEGININYNEYDRTFNNLVNFYKNQFSNQFSEDLIVSLDLKTQALNALIQKKLLLLQAEKYQIKVSNEELINHIQNVPTFQKDNRFDEGFYNDYLKFQRQTPLEFEESQREQLTIGKVESLIKSNTKVSESEIQEAFKADEEKVKLEFVVVPRNHFEAPDVDKISDADLNDFFAKSKAEFEIPEQFKVQYIKVEPKILQKDITPSKEDIEDYYKIRGADFRVKKMYTASHILIKPDEAATDEKSEDPPDAAVDSAREIAEDLLKQLRQGADFAELAQQYSEDKGSGANGGSLGEFPKGTMVIEFEDALDKLKVAEISEPVKTQFGIHLIRLDSVTDERVKPLSEVKASIIITLKETKSRQKARRTVKRIHQNALKEGDVGKAAQDQNVEVQESDFFSKKKRNLSGIGAAPEFYNAAFNLAAKEMSSPIHTFEASYLIKLIAKKPPYIPELAEVREEVRKALVKKRNQDYSKEKHKELGDKFSKSQNLEETAKELGLKVRNTPFISFNDSIPGIGNIQAIKEKVFDLQPGQSTTATSRDQFYLLRVKERKAPGTLDQNKRDAIVTRLQRQKGNAIYKDWLNDLQNRSDILIDKTLL